MFGKFQSIQDHFPHYALDYQERPEAKTEKRWIDRLWLDGSWSGNLYDFYRLVYPKLTSNLKIPFSLKDGSREEDTPVHVAIREALVNCLVHADYRHRARTLIVKRPDMFGFQNPGDMRIPLEIALQGEEPDSRNKRLAHLFGFIGIGEKAGTGIPKILSGWKSQHWRQPSLTEEHQPSPRTILKLQMLDLFDDDTLKNLTMFYGENFTTLDEAGRIAMAIAWSEQRLTHNRLCQLTNEHPSDITKTLRLLVDSQLLQSTGAGRGTTYRLFGDKTVEPEDVFSSLDKMLSIPNSEERIPNSEERRDQHGRLLTNLFHLPFIDSLEMLSEEFLNNLEKVCEGPRGKAAIPREQLYQVLLLACDGHFIKLACLAELVNRKAKTIQETYLKELCRDQKMTMAFPDKPTHNDQAYTTTQASL